MNSFVIRSIKTTDFPKVKSLVGSIKAGLTSLPNHSDFLKQKVMRADAAFQSEITKPGDEHYLFLLEQQDTGKIAGICGIYAYAGGHKPFQCLVQESINQEYESLGIKKNHQLLRYTELEDVPSEVCSLYMHPKFRGMGQGRLLSLCRYFYIKEHPKRFKDQVIAELRGYRDKNGKSPFYQHIVRPFFGQSLKENDYLRAVSPPEFISDLYPRYPIYTSMLPPEARGVIGRVYKNTRPALHLLLKEGFKENGQLDLFDAGPFLSAKVKDIRTVKLIKKGVLKKVFKQRDNKGSFIIARHDPEFRACIGCVDIYSDRSLGINENAATLLQVEPGQTIDYAPSN